nr:hypothetical protein [Tanacetum cinerariifolium]
KVDPKLNIETDSTFVGSSFLDQEMQEVDSDQSMPDDEIISVSGNDKEVDDSKELSYANENVFDNVIDKLVLSKSNKKIMVKAVKMNVRSQIEKVNGLLRQCDKHHMQLIKYIEHIMYSTIKVPRDIMV